VHINNILRSTNFLHGALKGAPVHAFRLCNVVADAAIGPKLSTQAKARGRARLRGVSRCDRCLSADKIDQHVRDADFADLFISHNVQAIIQKRALELGIRARHQVPS
jgi:hypothetical protein